MNFQAPWRFSIRVGMISFTFRLLLLMGMCMAAAKTLNPVQETFSEYLFALNNGILGKECSPVNAKATWWQENERFSGIGDLEICFSHFGCTYYTMKNRTHTVSMKENSLILSRGGVDMCIFLKVFFSPEKFDETEVCQFSHAQRDFCIRLPALTLSSIPTTINTSINVWAEIPSVSGKMTQVPLRTQLLQHTSLAVSVEGARCNASTTISEEDMPILDFVGPHGFVFPVVSFPLSQAPEASKKRLLQIFGYACIDFEDAKEKGASRTRRCSTLDGLKENRPFDSLAFSITDELVHTLVFTLLPGKPCQTSGKYLHMKFQDAVQFKYSASELQVAMWSAVMLSAVAKQFTSAFAGVKSLLASAGGCTGGIEHSSSFLNFLPMYSTPLMAVTKLGWEEGVKEVLSWLPSLQMKDCIPLDLRDRDGQPLLEVATTYGSLATVDIMKRLVAASSTLSPDRKYEDMCLAMTGAARYGHHDNFAYFQSHAWRTAHPYGLSLLLASAAGHYEIVEALLFADTQEQDQTLKLKEAIVPRSCLERERGRYGVDPGRHHNHLHHTALIAATRQGHVDVVKRLAMHLPASIEVMDGSGYTAIMWAGFLETPRRLETAKILIEAGADPTRLMNYGNIPFVDTVEDSAMINILHGSPHVTSYNRIKTEGRDIAVCFRGGLRSYHQVKHAMKERWFDPLGEGGRLSLIGLQAFGDKKFEEAKEAGEFSPLHFDVLNLQPTRDPRTYLDNYDPVIYQSCTPYAAQRGLSSSLEAMLLLNHDISRCADSVEKLESRRGGAKFTHIFLLRWDIYPLKKMAFEYLQGIDTTIIVPNLVGTGIDETAALGPRRYMMKYLRGIESQWYKILTKMEPCKHVTNFEEIVRFVLANAGVPVSSNAWLNSRKVRTEGWCRQSNNCAI